MYEYACKPVRVIDGDSLIATIDLGFHIQFNTSVRLYGVDTPESRTRDPEEKKCGLNRLKMAPFDVISNAN